MNTKNKFTFIDLFAGIGGFHTALKDLNGKCVFASEFDDDAVATYQKNFSIDVSGDIEKIKAEDIPKFDFLCAGFPCQPFSKGGYRKGFVDTRGKLFFEIIRIIKYHKPSIVLLENVSNLTTHDKGHTYKIIIEELNKLGYVTTKEPMILSPHHFGQPVYRPRLYIPCVHKSKTNKKFLDINLEFKMLKDNVYSLIDKTKKQKEFYISKYEKRVLDMWNEFYTNIDIKVIGYPIWIDEFKCRKKINTLPKWKQNIINKNRELYKRNKKFIDGWLKKHDNLTWCQMTHKKFEWQAGEDCKNIYEGLIQFRPSGVRVKRPDRFSTLVAMNHSQIVGRYKRRLTPDETKKLQALPNNFKLHVNKNIALKQLGNAVNVKVVKIISKNLLKNLR